MPIITKSGGAVSSATSGALGIPFETGNEAWLEKLYRDITSYLTPYFDEDLYEFVEGFPTIALLTDRLPFNRTIVHIEIDDIQNPPLGFGENIVDSLINYGDKVVSPIEASWHEVNFDIGVWTSAGAGGSTARLRVYQILTNVFVGSSARQAIREATGIQILDFTGGRFSQEEINEQPIWRIINITLHTRVFSRKVADMPIPYIDLDTVLQDQELTDVENNVISG